MLSIQQGAAVPFSLVFAAFAAIFAIEVGKNAVNDLCDFRSGADPGVRPEERSPFSGGKRVLVDELLTEGELIAIAFMAFAFAFGFGSYVALRAGTAVLLLGTAGAGLAFAYSADPFRLSYRGLGEVAVGLAYGPGIVLGTEWLFTKELTNAAAFASLSLGLLITSVLLANELPDERADREAAKRTLVVRLGSARAVGLCAVLSLGSYAVALEGVLFGAPPFLLGLLLGLPFTLLALGRLRLATVGSVRIQGQIFSLIAYVAAGLGLVLALTLSLSSPS
jgi:1,4-dihydroxy-2-naphthoate octaprenyltransferase